MAYQQDGNFSMAANQVLQNNGMDTSYGQPQQNQASFNMGGGNPALGHYINQLNYNNAINQNQLHQQYDQLQNQNMQLAQMQTEQENLKRQLAMQRTFAQQARHKIQAPSSRQKEANALLMLDNFQRSLNGDRGGGIASMFENNELLNPRRRPSKTYSFNNVPSSREKPPTSYARQKEPEPYQNYQQPVHQSAFQNAANMMINPMSPGMYPPQNYSPYPQGWVDPFGMPQSPYPQEPKKESTSSKTAEILMASLEKQNMILSELTGSINRDRDHKIVQEAKEIENKIRQMEFESQAKQYQLLTQNTTNSLSSNYNRPLVDVNLQKQNDLMPGMLPNLISPLQMVQLQSIMQNGNNPFGFGAQPTFSALPNEFMQHQKALQRYKEKQKKKDKKKKNKLKELLLLLGLEDDDDTAPQVIEVEPQQTEPTPGGKTKKAAKKQRDKEAEAENKALNEEIAKLEEEKKAKEQEEFLKKRKRRTQAMLWTRLYPILFYIDFYAEKTGAREESHQQLSEKIGINMDNTKGWITKSAMKGFEMVINNAKLNLAIVPFGGKKLNAKDLETRPAEIQKILKTLMDGLINNTKEGVLPSQLVTFLGEISQDYMYPPQNYLFAFEVNRLNFTHNAALKETTPPKTQMICAMFVLIRAFIGELLLQPDKVIGSAKVNDVLMRNVKTLASILVIAILEYLRSRVLVQNNNQNHLDLELKVKPRSGPYQFNCPVDLKDDPEEEGAKNKKKDETEILVKDMYTKEQLSTYFGKKNLVDELKALVEGWCNSIGTIVSNNYEEERKKRLANRKK